MSSSIYLRCLTGILLLLFASCANDPVDDDLKTGNNVEVQLTMTFGDYTRSLSKEPQQENPGICASSSELQQLAANGYLVANISIIRAGHSVADNYNVKVKFANNKFITDPIALPLGTSVLTQYTITNNTSQNPVVLFSAVNATSTLYSSFVPSGYLLPYNIVLTENDKYNKTTMDVYVLCAIHETPESFGFVKWNTHFIKLYCFPFDVNSCPDNGQLKGASGRIAMYHAEKRNNEISKGEKITEFKFPGNNNKHAEFCFPDDYDIPNNEEFYYFELYTNYKNVENPLPVTGIANVTTLLDYKNSNAWDIIKKALNINLCECKNWFFQCQEYKLGTFVFEDLWPEEGDYDFNDFIVEYHISKIYDTESATRSQRFVKSIEMDFDLKAQGAGYIGNAFAVRFDGMPYAPGNISVSRLCDNRSGSGYQNYNLGDTNWGVLDNQGVQYTPDGVVVLPIIENAQLKFLITQYGGQPHINTIQSDYAKRGKGFKYKITISFANAVNDNFKILPMLFPQGERGREINLPLTKPTAFCDYSAKTGIDPNNPPAGHIFYAFGTDHLPWALDVPYLNIRYAQEFKEVDVVYSPQFQQWCQSLYSGEPTWWNKVLDPNINFFYNRAAYQDIE